MQKGYDANAYRRFVSFVSDLLRGYGVTLNMADKESKTPS